METAGLVVGLAGLAGLFNVCNSTFQLVQRGRAFPQDYRILETKFNNQELRLRAWGRAWGLVDDTHYDERLEEPDLNRQLVATLECIKLLLNDAEQLKDRYGLKQCIRPAGGSQSDSSASMTSSPSYLDRGSRLERRRSFNPLLRLRSRPDQNRPNSRGSAAMWAIDDRQKFAELVKHLKEFIDDLEDLTKVPEIRYRQRVFVHYEIECIEDVEELEDIEMAREGDEDVVSDAASVRLEQLSQGTPSVRASMESLGSSFTLESYFTARSHISSNLSIADSASWGRISVEHDVAAHNPISSQSSLEAIRHKIKEGRYTPAERLSMLLSTPSSLSPFLLKGRVKECYK